MNYRLLLQGSDFHPHLSHDRYGSINCHNQLIKYKCVRPDANLFVEYIDHPMGFPGSSTSKESAYNSGNTGLISG